MNNTAHAYHPETGIYLGEVECQFNPLEVGQLIIPAHATDVKPPKPGKGKIAVWSGEKWELQSLPSE